MKLQNAVLQQFPFFENNPNSVTYFSTGVFSNCTGLTEIYCKNPTPPELKSWATAGSNPFYKVDKNTCKLYVPKGSKDAYVSKWSWIRTNVIEMDFTDIKSINEDKATIKSVANSIVIETKVQTPVSIYNLSGQKVYQSVIDGNKEIPLNKGVYIVNVDNESEKIIVK